MAELRAGLLQACDDERLFNFAPWPRQRELLEAVECGPRTHVWALGRRSGKSTKAGVVGLWDCLCRPELDRMVRAGETRYAVSVATNVNQARLIVNAARSILERSPVLSSLLEGQTEDELRFRTPSGAKTVLRAFPCSSRGGRGWPISSLFMDECAHFLIDSEGDRTGARVWEALAPSTAQFGDKARIILCSTPYGESGFFAEFFDRAHKGEIQDAVAVRYPTWEMNPTISEVFLRGEEKRDPESYRSEYAAEFVGSGAGFIDFDRVDLVGAPVAGPKDASTWVAGLDPAFSKDPFGVALVGRTPDGRLVAGPVFSLRPGGNFNGPIDEIARVVKEYGADCVTDQFCQAPVIERLKYHHGLQARVNAMTAQSKTEVYQQLRIKLYDGSLVLPDHPDLIAELRRLRTKYSAGSAAVVNPRVGGSHGDMAQALAMAVGELASVVDLSAFASSEHGFFAAEPRPSRWDFDAASYGV